MSRRNLLKRFSCLLDDREISVKNWEKTDGALIQEQYDYRQVCAQLELAYQTDSKAEQVKEND